MVCALSVSHSQRPAWLWCHHILLPHIFKTHDQSTILHLNMKSLLGHCHSLIVYLRDNTHILHIFRLTESCKTFSTLSRHRLCLFFTLKLSQEIGYQVLCLLFNCIVSSSNLFCPNHFRFVWECVYTGCLCLQTESLSWLLDFFFFPPLSWCCKCRLVCQLLFIDCWLST